MIDWCIYGAETIVNETSSSNDRIGYDFTFNLMLVQLPRSPPSSQNVRNNRGILSSDRSHFHIQVGGGLHHN